MWGRKPSPEAEQEKKEMTAVKRRLSRVEVRLEMLAAQVNVISRKPKESE